MVRLIEPDIMFCVDYEVTRINVVPFENHLKDFRLVHSSLLHEIDNLILHNNCVIHVVVQLNLNFVLKLPLLCQKVLFIYWFCEVLVVFCEQVELTNMAPRVEPIAQWILGEESHVLAASKNENLMDFALKVLPVEDVGKPCKAVETVEKRQGHLPTPAERIHEKDVP